jgi:hypothetical protein
MNLSGEVYFNMFRLPHPIAGRSEFMLKRWTKHTIYSLSGSYKHPESQSWHRVDDTRFNMYSTNSIYLYDYVLVSDKWFLASVYTSSAVDSTPAATSSYVGTFNGTASYYHGINTWQNSPNAISNNYLLRYNPLASIFEGYPVYGVDANYNPNFLPPPYSGTLTPAQYQTWMNTPVYRDDGIYFEIIWGYPRNHHTHKRQTLSAERFMTYGIRGDIIAGRTVVSASYRKGMQTAGTTIGLDGLGDGSDPIQTTQVTNIDLIQADNVIYH